MKSFITWLPPSRQSIALVACLLIVVLLGHAGAFAQSGPTLVTTVYLPLVASAPAALPLVENGDFEGGSSGAWRETSSGTGAGTLIRSADRLASGVTPRSGQWAAWLGGLNNETSTLTQRIAVPVEAAPQPLRLFYALWVRSGDSCGNDTFRLQINGVNIHKVDLCAQTNASGWSLNSVDLTPYAGRTANLSFQVVTNGSFISSVFLDDIVTTQSSPALAVE